MQVWQPGYPNNLGPVAFRPTIARGLALSVYLFSQLTKRNNYATWIQKR